MNLEQKILQLLINAAEFGDDLDPIDFWNAIDKRAEDHLSEAALESFNSWSR